MTQVDPKRRIQGVFALAATLTLAMPLVAKGATPAQTCESGKNLTAGKYVACLHKARAKFVKSGETDPASYDDAVLECGSRYSGKWTSLEDKAAGECPSTGDETDLQDFLDACIFSAVDALGGAALPADVVTCNESLTTCNSSLDNCDDDLTTCNGSLGTCNDSLSTCNTSLDSCTAGTAAAADVLAGQTFSSSAGLGVAGTMPNNGAVTLTPSTSDQAIAAGYHDGSGKCAGDADLVASNIKSGVELFGVTGTLENAADCGNGTFDDGEECELGTLNGQTCVTRGYSTGTLACSPGTCTFDESDCVLSAYKRVFVTSTSSNGNLGGLAGADGTCNARAAAASLGGTWVAWLSTSTVDAKDRIADTEYRRVDGATIIADDKADLIDGSLDNAVLTNEFGTSVGSALVHTGTSSSGVEVGTANTCGDWTIGTFSGTGADDTVVGQADRTTAGWTQEIGPGVGCSNSFRLYCFEQ